VSAAPRGARRTVLVSGAGLIGTSVALALRSGGHDVLVSDIDPEHVRLSVALGAGRPHAGEDVEVAVVAVPPRAVPQAVAAALAAAPGCTVTDTASVKRQPLHDLESLIAGGAGLERFIGGHPLAGAETSGPAGARADLFAGRRWVLTPGANTSGRALADAGWLVESCGARVLLMTADEHDDALALTSHLPQIAASALASLLGTADEYVLRTAGAGLRDMTRVAASDSRLWTEIAAANAGPLAAALDAFSARLTGVSAALRERHEAEVSRLLSDGRRGHDRILAE
jgi:prephenate dehydrogenase